MIETLKHKWLFVSWLLLIVGSLVQLTVQFQQGISIKMDILELLPRVEDANIDDTSTNGNKQAEKQVKQLRAPQIFVDRSVNTVANKVVFLVGHPKKQVALTQANQLYKTFAQHSAVTDSFLQVDQDNLQAVAALYFPYRFGLFAEKAVIDLSKQNIDGLIANAQKQLYSPVSAANSKLIEHDPLFLFYDFLTQLPSANGNMQLDDGYLLTQANDQVYVLVSFVLAEAYKKQLSFVAETKQYHQQLQAQYPDVTLLKAGVASMSLS